MQVLVNSLQGTLCIPFSSNQVSVLAIKQKINDIDGIPAHLISLQQSGKYLQNEQYLAHGATHILNLTLPICGGKGGFGSLLRGGQPGKRSKKTNNTNACRDLATGKRMKYVNNEKKLEEWLDKEEERKLQKKGEQYVKELEIKEKYKFDDKQLAEESKQLQTSVSSAVKQGLKRKRSNVSSSSTSSTSSTSSSSSSTSSSSSSSSSSDDSNDQPRKRKKVWANLGVLSDSDSSDESDSEDEGEDDQPIINSNSNSKPTTVVNEKEEDNENEIGDDNKNENNDNNNKNEIEDDKNEDDIDLSKYSSAKELEKVGLEALKAALSYNGLKCGGNLQQRANRLWSTKALPKSKWPSSIFAKQRKQTK